MAAHKLLPHYAQTRKTKNFATEPITVASGDVATGGTGDDDFTFDPTNTDGPGTITIAGGTDGTRGAHDDTANGNDGDTLDLSNLSNVTFTTGPTDTADGKLGTFTYTNDQNEVITVNFSEIENIIMPPNGVVDGEATADNMAPGYNDTIGATDGGGDIIDGADGPNDSIAGNGGNDTIDAGLGNDTVDGGADNDSITGGAGDDSVSGGTGSDTLVGGAGDDVFTVDTTDPTANVAAVIDGGTDGTDGFPDDNSNGDVGDALDLSGQAAPVDVTFGANPENGTVDGIDTIAGDTDITFSEIEQVLTTNLNDTIDGAAATGPINVDAGAGDDTITGGTGNDTIGAGDGADTVDGGAGDDRIDLGADPLNPTNPDGKVDTVVIDDGDGNDIIDNFDAPVLDVNGDPTTPNDKLDVSGLTDAGGDPVNVDDVTVTDTNGDGTGDPIITFPNGESVTLVGVDPAQFLDPATQDDALKALGIPGPGPNGIVDGEVTGDNMAPGYNDTIGATDGGGDIIDGADGLNDSIAGNGGNDTIDAGLGNDTVDGGADNGSITGGAGDDSVSGGTGNDTLFGEDGADTLDGGAGDDSMLGGIGNDSIIGFEGSDTVDGGDGDDFINTRTSVGTGVPDEGLVFPDNPATFPNETTLYSYPADADPNNDKDSVIGGAGNDTILTGDDDDTIDGGIGNDIIDAGFDDDTVTGGAGADSIQGGEGSDTIDGGDDDDVIYGGISPLDPNYTLAQNYDLEDDGTNTSVDPNPTNNTDSLLGGAGNDRIYGGDDNDTLEGGTGADTLDGGIDDDSLIGGAGADVLTGGQGDDDFVYNAGDGGSIRNSVYEAQPMRLKRVIC